MSFPTGFAMTIDGRAVAGDGSFVVLNPATLAPVGEAPLATAAHLDSAVAAARSALPGWRALSIEGRKPYLRAASDALRLRIEDFAALLTAEQGKPLAEAREEVGGAAFWLREVGKLTLPTAVHEDSDRRLVETRYRPIGVVGAIVPWNFPVLLTMFKLAPALLAGNCVVLKPSPFTPLTALAFGELMRDVLPAGVLNVISGDDTLGPALTGHPGIDKISFTGSTETGRAVMRGAAGSLKRITLELGGNDAAIVLPDVDLNKAVPNLFWAAMRNNGQLCIAAKRIFVHEDIFDRFLAAMTDYAQSVAIGDGAVDGVQIGPVQNERQLQRVRALLSETKDAGLSVTTTELDNCLPGYFLPISIVANPPDDSAVVRQEQFGPIIPLLKFSSDEEVVARANASEYGLAGSVWSADVEHARKIADALETGTVWINEAHYLHPLVPFAGRRQSGLGIENGLDGFKEFVVPHTIVTARG